MEGWLFWQQILSWLFSGAITWAARVSVPSLSLVFDIRSCPTSTVAVHGIPRELYHDLPRSGGHIAQYPSV